MSALEETKCNLCGSDKFTVVYEAQLKSEDPDSASCTCTNTGHGEFYRVLKCNECGLVYCSPRPSEQITFDSYSEVCDSVYKEQEHGRILTFEKLLKELETYRKEKGKLLDIGASTGVFLNCAAGRGWDVQGIEPSVWCTEEASKKELLKGRIVSGTYRDIEKFSDKFDVISMWDVIEHLHDPMNALETCAGKLKDGGLLALTTIDIGSLFAKISGKRWPWLMKMHLYYFDRKTIEAYLKESGFELLAVKPYVHVISLEYLIFKMDSLFRPAGFLMRLLSKILFINAKFIHIPISLGDCITIYALKVKKS